jgi:segregation and condensation protein A
MTHTVAVGEFEGPLGVLLELVERNKLEVSAISVGRITSEYLKYVRTLKVSAEDLSEFLQLGARLLYIKSLALLPRESADEQATELHQLSLELAEYRRFQAAAKTLAGRAPARTWTKPASPRLSPEELPLPDLKLDQLAEAFTRALKLVPPAAPVGVIKQHLSLERATKNLRTLLPNGFELHTVLERCRDRLEIVVTFLAILELVRSGAAQVVQAGQFEPIRVEQAQYA